MFDCEIKNCQTDFLWQTESEELILAVALHPLSSTLMWSDSNHYPMVTQGGHVAGVR